MEKAEQTTSEILNKIINAIDQELALEYWEKTCNTQEYLVIADNGKLLLVTNSQLIKESSVEKETR